MLQSNPLGNGNAHSRSVSLCPVKPIHPRPDRRRTISQNMKYLNWVRIMAAVATLCCSVGYGSGLKITAGGDLVMNSPFSGIGTITDPVRVSAIMSGQNAVLQIFNLDRYGNFALTTHDDAIWVQLEFLNATTVAWGNFDFELQIIPGQPSTNPDGLSFAQGYMVGERPWTSDKFASFEEWDQERDFINFKDGVVLPGETAVMNFIISHSGTARSVQLMTRPNLVPAAPPVPEPSTWALGSLAVVGWFWARRRRS